MAQHFSLPPVSGPPYETEERILWDKVRKEVRGLAVHWPEGTWKRAKELGYFEALAHEAWLETKYYKGKK